MASVDTTDQTPGAPRPPSAGPSARPSARPIPASLWWVLGFVLILALAAVLGYAFLYILLPLLFLTVLVKSGDKSEAVSRVAGEVKKESEEMFSYFRGTFTHVRGEKRGRPNRYALRSALGMILLGLGIFAITGYLPIYEHILRNSLRLSGSQSHSLAMLLIIFIALTGVVADVTIRYGRRKKREASDGGEEHAPHSSDDGSPRDQQPAQNSGGFVYAFLVAFVVMIAGALLFFQGILYFEFYKTQAAEGSQLPFALGTAAIFIAAVEMLNFYWASRLAFDFVTWLFIHLVLLAPPALLAKVAALAEQGDSQTLRTRSGDDETRGPTEP